MFLLLQLIADWWHDNMATFTYKRKGLSNEGKIELQKYKMELGGVLDLKCVGNLVL